MSLPENVRVGPFDFPVAFSEHNALLKNETGGTLDGATHTIEIDPGLCIQKQWETLIHEALHGMAESAGVELSEQDVCTLSMLLYGFLKDNAEALKAIE